MYIYVYIYMYICIYIERYRYTLPVVEKRSMGKWLGGACCRTCRTVPGPSFSIPGA